MKLTAMALASTFALSGSCGFAHTIPHKSEVRTHTIYRNAARPIILQPNYGKLNGNSSGYGHTDVWGHFGAYYGPMIPSGAGGR
jgi:hypothetical protein